MVTLGDRLMVGRNRQGRRFPVEVPPDGKSGWSVVRSRLVEQALATR